MKKFLRELKYFWLANVQPYLVEKSFFWVAAVANFSQIMGVRWNKVSWLIPSYVREKDAEHVFVKNGLIYSIFLNGMGESYFSLPQSVQKCLQYAWYCGYVRYPDSPFLQTKPTKPKGMPFREYITDVLAHSDGRFADYIPVHGGITFEQGDKAGYVIGFDCNHYGDERNLLTSDPDWVADQIHKMRLAIDVCKNHRFEQRYVTTRDYEERQQIIEEFTETLQEHGIDYGHSVNYNILFRMASGNL